VLRKGPRFHSGDPVTAEDVKFSFERYRGISAKPLKDRVAAIETPDPGRVRFRLKQPWPDFLTFYGGIATGANWVVPKKYVERVGEEGFKKAPIGAGPYRMVSFTPGIELVLEATDSYWRKTPSVKRLIFKSVPDVATRLVALKSGDADGAYALPGELGEEVQRSAGLTLRPTPFTSTHWLLFADQFDKSSPWHDRRVRLAATHAVDRQTINQAVSLGFSKITGSIIPTSFDFYWQPPVHPHDPARAKKLLAEAGYPNGFGLVLYTPNDRYINDALVAQAVAQMLTRIGLKVAVEAMTQSQFFAKRNRREFGFWLAGWGAGTGEMSSPLRALAATPNRDKGTGTSNSGGYSNPKVDALIDKALATVDDAKRAETLAEASRVAMDDYGVIPLHFEMTTWAFRKDLSYVPRADQMTQATLVTPAR
jgi:peptide/nickel transport system substrate-binding protein